MRGGDHGDGEGGAADDGCAGRDRVQARAAHGAPRRHGQASARIRRGFWVVVVLVRPGAHPQARERARVAVRLRLQRRRRRGRRRGCGGRRGRVGCRCQGGGRGRRRDVGGERQAQPRAGAVVAGARQAHQRPHDDVPGRGARHRGRGRVGDDARGPAGRDVEAGAVVAQHDRQRGAGAAPAARRHRGALSDVAAALQAGARVVPHVAQARRAARRHPR
mmetsp:Transcript_19471/g.68954  ORF Transcript_19471/g.68954 Transcript_19471/m.68954 type:complete len:219 (-) Transcript_19471:478-1134(-)